jgi:hypothetical protein
MAPILPINPWIFEQSIPRRYYRCGFCGAYVASVSGYLNDSGHSHSNSPSIYICPGCGYPTFFYKSIQTPAPPMGSRVQELPETVGSIYEEARRATMVEAHTCAVLACRKLLMHIAVDKGAATGKQFAFYIDYLSEKGYIPTSGKEWIDRIRQQGNDANHEIVVKSAQDAKEVIDFTEMLLRLIYEFPARLQKGQMLPLIDESRRVYTGESTATDTEV